MAMLLGTKGDDILKWRESARLVEGLKTRLTRKWGRSSADEAQSFLEGMAEALEAELDYESQLDTGLEALRRALGETVAPAELKGLTARHDELLAAHFSRRGSVLALTGAANAWHDLLVARTALLAEERMLSLGQGSAPVYALLVTGDRGREEQTLYGKNRYLLLHQLDSERFFLFTRQLAGALKEAGVIPGEEALWHGSLAEWRALLKGGNTTRKRDLREELENPLPAFVPPMKGGSTAMPDAQWRMEAMADLGFVTGYEPLADEALSAAASALKEQRSTEAFFQLARKAIHLPLALGHFGRWRLEKSGEHKGEIDVEGLGLSPLVGAVRVLAVHLGVQGGGTLHRVRELLYRGAFSVELAQRVLEALQCLMQLRIMSEIRGEETGSHSNPEEFTQEQDERIRNAFVAVLDLQKMAYQRMVGQG